MSRIDELIAELCGRGWSFNHWTKSQIDAIVSELEGADQ